MSGGGVASKLLGALREILMARFFGTGAAADALRGSHALALAPIHLFTRIVQSCFIPLFAGREKEDPAGAAALWRTVMVVFGGFGLVTAAALFAFAPLLVRLVLPGFSPERAALTVSMLRIIAVGVPFYVYCLLIGALGAAQKDYVVPALRPGVQNTGLIVMIAVAVAAGRPVWAAGGFVLAYVFLALFATAVLRRRGLIPAAGPLDRAAFRAGVARLWTLARPLLLLSLLVEGNLLVERFVASLLGPGRVAALDYARFLSESAHFLIAMPLGLMSLSVFARYTDDETRLGADKLLALLFLFFVPLSAFLFCNGGSVIAAFYLRGEFDAASLRMTERALLALSAGLWLYSGSFLLQRILNARLRNDIVLRGETLGVVLNVTFNLVFYRTLGIMVIGFGLALGSLASMIYYMARTKVRLRLVRKAARVLAAGLPVYFAGTYLLERLAGAGIAALVAQIVFACLLWGAAPLASADLRELIRSKLRG
jgi:putative peptidoglycan lipid II flippase